MRARTPNRSRADLRVTSRGGTVRLPDARRHESIARHQRRIDMRVPSPHGGSSHRGGSRRVRAHDEYRRSWVCYRLRSVRERHRVRVPGSDQRSRDVRRAAASERADAPWWSVWVAPCALRRRDQCRAGKGTRRQIGAPHQPEPVSLPDPIPSAARYRDHSSAASGWRTPRRSRSHSPSL